MRSGNESVKICSSRLIGAEYDTMIALSLLDAVCRCAAHFVQIIYSFCTGLIYELHKIYEDSGSNLRIIAGSVMMGICKTEILCKSVQIISSQFRQEYIGKGHGIQRSKIICKSKPFGINLDECGIEGSIVGYQHCSLTEFQESGEYLFYGIFLSLNLRDTIFICK